MDDGDGCVFSNKGAIITLGAAACIMLATFGVSKIASSASPQAPEKVTVKEAPKPELPPLPEPPKPKMVADTMGEGIVIVISKASQQMHVFAKGEAWGSSPVSTGKKGKETPAGVFAILQKRVKHNSNLYSNAPMPFMQRLTWDGIAIHAGRLPGYPASHGCIRLPREFAKALFELTGHTTTAVIVTDDPLADEQEALKLASATDAVVPIDPSVLDPKWAEEIRIAEAARVRDAEPNTETTAVASTTSANGGETIQLVAALSPGQAQAHWDGLLRQRAELGKMKMAIVPAKVNGQQYYRLQASAPDAHTKCGDLKQAGIACFPVG